MKSFQLEPTMKLRTTVVVCRGLFGEQASVGRVTEELMGYSDFQLHRFALVHPKRFGAYALEPACLQDSGKCALLARLLPQLQVLPPGHVDL